MQYTNSRSMANLLVCSLLVNSLTKLIMRKLKVTEMNRLTVDEFRTSDKMPLTVVLDDVRSLYNVGAVLRSCDAFRVEEVVLCGITAAPPHPEIHKTALGAEDSVSWRHADSALEAVLELRRQGVTVMAVEQCEGSTMLNTFVPETGRRYAIVLGNEVKGVRQDVVDECDGCLEIPQFGTKHSLNVSVTAGIVVWHFCQASMNNS